MLPLKTLLLLLLLFPLQVVQLQCCLRLTERGFYGPWELSLPCIFSQFLWYADRCFGSVDYLRSPDFLGVFSVSSRKWFTLGFPWHLQEGHKCLRFLLEFLWVVLTVSDWTRWIVVLLFLVFGAEVRSDASSPNWKTSCTVDPGRLGTLSRPPSSNFKPACGAKRPHLV